MEEEMNYCKHVDSNVAHKVGHKQLKQGTVCWIYMWHMQNISNVL